MFGIFTTTTLWEPRRADKQHRPWPTLVTAVTPAQLDLAVFTVAQSMPSYISLSDCVNFATARLIPGNVPLPWTDLGPIQPDHDLLNPTDQEQVIHDWLVRLGIHNGYQDIEQEIARTQRLPDHLLSLAALAGRAESGGRRDAGGVY